MKLRKSDIVEFNGAFYRVHSFNNNDFVITQNGNDFENVQKAELKKAKRTTNLLIGFSTFLLAVVETPTLAYLNKQVFYTRLFSELEIQISQIKTWVDGTNNFSEIEFTAGGEKVCKNYISKTKN